MATTFRPRPTSAPRSTIARLISLGAVALALLVPAGAWATYPGRNGPIAVMTKEADIGVIEPDGSGFRRLTDDPRYESTPGWSPDGRRIAFTRELSAQVFEIMDMDGDGSDSRQLTQLGGAAFGAAWSPDGSRIAFSFWAMDRPSPVADGILIMNPDGTGMRNVTHTTGDQDPQWSPDGRKIVFARLTGGSDAGLYVLDVASGQAKRVHAGFGDQNPDWSPDGRELVYSRMNALYVLNLRSGRERHLVGNFESDIVGVPRWSPNGRLIAFHAAFLSRLDTIHPNRRHRSSLTDSAEPPLAPGSWLAVTRR